MEHSGQSPEPGNHRPFRRLIIRVRKGAYLAFVGFIFLLVIRIYPNDLLLVTAWLFYIPLILVFVAALPFLICAFSRSPRYLITLGIFLILLGWNLAREQPRYFHLGSTPPDHSKAASLLVWNVHSYRFGEPEVAREIAAISPDILGIVSGTFRDRAPAQMERILGGEYTWSVGRDLSAASKLRVLESEVPRHGRGLRVFRVKMELEGKPFLLFIVYMDSPPRFGESQWFAELEDILASETLPMIVAGDFNTPRGSRRLSRLFSGWQDPFRAQRGSRYLTSWHRNFPLWQIDHVFMTTDFEVLSAELEYSPLSDHAWMFIHFQWKD